MSAAALPQDVCIISKSAPQMRSLSMARQLITMRLDKTKVRHRQAATARRPRSLARHEEVNTLHRTRLVKPLTRDVQWIDSASSMD